MVRSQAHTLKGAAGNVGAEMLQAAAYALEKAGQAGDQAQFVDLIARIKEDFEAFRQAFARSTA